MRLVMVEWVDSWSIHRWFTPDEIDWGTAAGVGCKTVGWIL